MLCLSGFELYSRWVPLIPLIIACDLAREASNIYTLGSKFNSFTLYAENVAATAAT